MARPLALALLFAMSTAAPAATPVPTPERPVVDTYFGRKITDDYRWLEAGADAEVQAWSDAQNQAARAYLDALPGRTRLEKRLTELLGYEAPTWSRLTWRNGVLLALKQQPPRAQPMIVVLASLERAEGERVLLDPAVLDPTGRTAIDFFEPSLDGKFVAVSLSRGGSERGDVHVFEVATGRELAGDTVPYVNTGTAGGSVAWTADGFYYTRHPHEGERPAADLGFYQQVYFHRLGTPTSADTYELGRDFLRIAENFLDTSADGRWAADLVQKGDGGEYELFVRAPDQRWTKVAEYRDRIVGLTFGPGPTLYLLSRKGAPRGEVLELPLEPGALSLARARKVVPAGQGAIQAMVATAQRLYLVEQLGGPSHVRILDRAGRPLGEVPTPPVTAATGVTSIGEGDDLLVSVSGYLNPVGVHRFQAADGKLVATPYAAKAPVDLSGYEVTRQECVSKDGTRVPLNLVHRKGLVLDGRNPTLLTGYGGFGISIQPGFSRTLPVWLEAGGVFAQANLRGGGEFGEDWHQQGMLRRKQHVFDDFIACARWLVDHRYTTPRRLAIEGGSNGGLLMGAALTQAPAAFRAVVAHVGYFDMLRFEVAPNGVFNTTEYGTVKDADDFKALAAYSPLQHVRNGTAYPAVLFMTGKNDPRVDPFHSRKMVARLQATGTKLPILLRTADTGHGMGTPLAERIAQAVDSHAFLFHELGMKAD